MSYKPLILSVFSILFLFMPSAHSAPIHETNSILLASRNGDGPVYDEVMREMDARKWAIRAQEREARETNWRENNSHRHHHQHQKEKAQGNYGDKTSSPAR
jgi:hypothetical protein